MVIKDIERPDKDFKLLIEEQRVKNILYIISYSYAPALGNIGSRVSVSKINEDSFDNYEEIHGLDFSDGKLKSYYLIADKNSSSHESSYLNDDLEYYDEVIGAFDELINSGDSEFTFKALKVLEEVKNQVIRIGSAKNGI